jgi:hypothetical protein
MSPLKLQYTDLGANELQAVVMTQTYPATCFSKLNLQAQANAQYYVSSFFHYQQLYN